MESEQQKLVRLLLPKQFLIQLSIYYSIYGYLWGSFAAPTMSQKPKDRSLGDEDHFAIMQARFPMNK